MTQTISLRLIASSVLFMAATASPGQTAKPGPKPGVAAQHPATAAVHSAPVAVPCTKLPELSPKIPALPAGLPCAKPLYTVTTEPNVKLEYISPLEGPELRETLGLESSSFSLSYVDTKVGAGELAAPHKWYTIHYTGYLIDGTKFDSSVDRGEPISINYGQHQVITGWDTGFGGMRVGGKRRLFIPFQLAYGPTAHGPIPAKSELIFDVELISQSDEKPEPKPKPASTPNDSTSPVPGKPATPPPADMPSTTDTPKTANPETH